MHTSYSGLLEINGILSRGLLGVNPYTGEKNDPVKELPTGIFRHLKRLYKAVKDEMEIIQPEHREFIEKWAVDGKWPTHDSEKFAEFKPLYDEFFGMADIVIPISRFHTELLDDLKIVLPVDLQNLMEDINSSIEFEEKQKETPPATVVSNKGPESPPPDV